MKIYFISGLGADERVFSFLKLPEVEKVFIKWLPPHKKESLSDYSKRLIEQIDLSEDAVLVGVSFGGVIAQEISKIIPCKKVLIISSVKTHKELDWQLMVVRFFQLHRLFCSWFLIKANLLTAKYYYSITSKDELQLLKRIIMDTDREFMVWAIDAIINWTNHDYPDNLVHIHGTNDRIFPIYKISNCIKVDGGGHLMIVSLSNQIEKIILKILE